MTSRRKEKTPDPENPLDQLQFSFMDTPLRILYLDDDPGMAATIRRLIEAEGVATGITVAKSLLSFRRQIKKTSFDLILAEYQLSEDSGLDGLAVVRERDPSIPFIFLSQEADAAKVVAALRQGANDFIPKAQLQRLIPAINGALRDRQEVLRQRQAAKRQTEILQELRLANHIHQSVHQSVPLGDIFAHFSKESCALFNGNQATIHLLSDDASFLLPQKLGLSPKQREQIEQVIGFCIPDLKIPLLPHSIYEKVISEGTNLLLNDPDAIQNLLISYIPCVAKPGSSLYKLIHQAVPRIVQILKIQSTMVVPLKTRDQIFGLMDISRDHPFTEGDLERLTRLATEIAIAIQRRKNDEKTESIHDIYVRAIENMDSIPYRLYYQDGQYRYIGEGVRQLLGVSKADLTFEKMREMLREIHICGVPDNTDPREHGRKFQEGQFDEYRADLRIVRPDGSECWMSDSAVPIRDAKSGTVIGSLGILQDITERKNREQSLTQARDMFFSLLDDFPSMVWQTNKHGKCDYFNKTWLRFTGCTLAQEIGEGWMNNIHPEDLQRNTQGFQEAFQNSRPFEMEYRLRHHSGEYRWVLDIGHPYRDLDGNFGGYIGTCYDISKRKQTEEEKVIIQRQLLQAQKMEAIGNLAGGVAHDFNNLLTVIQGHTQIMLMGTDESTDQYRELKQILKASNRAAHLTSQLLLFSRKQPMEFVPVNLNETVGRLLKMLQRLIGEDILIHPQLCREPWNILADEGNIEQVITNLVVNARDAMQTGGTITIRTENVYLDEIAARAWKYSRPGHYMRLSIEDTGNGMDEETTRHIFEPFFTTKEKGKGTGLGLSVAYGIIKKHNGWINVYSELSKGTIFKIYLPRTKQSSFSCYEIDTDTTLLRGQNQTVLLVEDEPDLLRLAQNVLEENGYRTLTAADAGQALSLFEKEKDRVELVLSDVIMPGQNGIELVNQLLQQKPDLKVILSSGYTDEKVRLNVIREHGFHYIQKPYSMTDLLKMLQKVFADSN